MIKSSICKTSFVKYTTWYKNYFLKFRGEYVDYADSYWLRPYLHHSTYVIMLYESLRCYNAWKKADMAGGGGGGGGVTFKRLLLEWKWIYILFKFQNFKCF